MDLTILGSGGCTVIPKPLCTCRICNEARRKGPPYERTGPSAFIHDEKILIDTPAEIASQLNRSLIDSVKYLLFTHLDPDHMEGFRVVEQIALDFRSWKAYPDKKICLILPTMLMNSLHKICSQYGPLVDYYENQGFIKCITFEENLQIGNIQVTAIPVDRGDQISFIYVFEKQGRKLVYAPCDIKPFPEERKEVTHANLLAIQPGIFETNLRHNFTYPLDHISRKTLYTFEETVALSRRIKTEQILFVHLEEYWNRSYENYLTLQYKFDNIQFAYDGIRIVV